MWWWWRGNLVVGLIASETSVATALPARLEARYLLLCVSDPTWSAHVASDDGSDIFQRRRLLLCLRWNASEIRCRCRCPRRLFRLPRGRAGEDVPHAVKQLPDSDHRNRVRHGISFLVTDHVLCTLWIGKQDRLLIRPIPSLPSAIFRLGIGRFNRQRRLSPPIPRDSRAGTRDGRQTVRGDRLRGGFVRLVGERDEDQLQCADEQIQQREVYPAEVVICTSRRSRLVRWIVVWQQSASITAAAYLFRQSR